MFLLGELAAPLVGGRRQKPCFAQLFAFEPTSLGSRGMGQRRGEIVALQRLRGGSQVQRRCTTGLTAELEMLGQHEGIPLARGLKPAGSQAVTEHAVRIREHGVGGISYQRVTEHVFGFARKAGLPPMAD